ncbi:S-adenosyl-L-methionine-dependent methyltransferase [Jimgerdemannia flammicorona]|uniref:S-adenosyl-L-methionine-dependent methyltransferase n=1 Tax=Jimgerdemannia flammicorona TaxID=994334 RepID=A0A433PGV7_9FUNG|nr:S-adenosyl-L-methionine-dependent methyltransferase [Jimgerdemannia flammicorona]
MGNVVSGERPQPLPHGVTRSRPRFSIRRLHSAPDINSRQPHPTTAAGGSGAGRRKEFLEPKHTTSSMQNNTSRSGRTTTSLPAPLLASDSYPQHFYPHGDFIPPSATGASKIANGPTTPTTPNIPYHLTMTTASTSDSPTPPRSGSLPPQSGLSDNPGNWKWLGGRPFTDLPGSTYLLPTDVEELDRLRALHDVLKWAFEGNHSVPLSREDLVGAKVLDVGCGAGTWVLEMSASHPSTHFTGIDLVDLYPPESQWPENCTFVRGDLLSTGGLPFQSDTYDLVHMRLMSYGLCAERWQSVLSELRRVTKRGGWIQLSEHDAFQYRAGPATSRFVYYGASTNALQARDVDPFVARSLDTLLRHANLVSVRNTYLSIPCGSWGGRAGTLFKEDVIRTYRAMSPWMAPAMNVTREEFEAMLVAMENEHAPNRTYLNWYVACGRKPRIVGHIGTEGVEEQDMPGVEGSNWRTGRPEVEPTHVKGKSIVGGPDYWGGVAEVGL